MLKEKQADVTQLEAARKNGTLSASSSTSSFRRNEFPNSINSSSSYGNLALDVERPPSKDPITRLQNNTDLMRRASKRFSAYQTSSIISMQSPKFGSSSLTVPIYEETVPEINAYDLEKAKNSSDIDINIDDTNKTINNTETTNSVDNMKTVSQNGSKAPSNRVERQGSASNNMKQQVISDTTKILTGEHKKTDNTAKKEVFLKVKDEVKKVKLNLPTTTANLKILFTQKFNYSPPGISTFPKIYIQDNTTSVAYELENLEDVTYGCILSLQQPDIQTAIFKHVDSQIGTVKNDMMNMEDRIMKKIENLQLIRTPATSASSYRKSDDVDFEKNMKKKLEKNEDQQKIIDELQDEINKIKQHQHRSLKRMNGVVSETTDFIAKFQENGMIPGGMNENTYVKECKSKVSEGCESLVEKLDDLQDVIEFIKRDITKHNIKPSDKQLDHLSKEMSKTKNDLTQLTEYTQSERKNLSLVWNRQMATIAGDQRFFKAQEEIMGLLEQDYQSAQETFELIVSCAKQLEKGSLSYKAKLPVPDPTVSPWDASKLVMAEVDAINPNHEERVEAILKAERVREMEKELRLRDEFQEELGDFVSNDKLNKIAGGISEIERKRQEKDLEHMKNTLGVV